MKIPKYQMLKDMIPKDQNPKVSTYGPELPSWVDCGCHKAPTCQQCGPMDMCNGDCEFAYGCFPKNGDDECDTSDQGQCSKDDVGSCDACSECEATVTWTCSLPTECCAEKPCGPCHDCIYGKCVFRNCGDCNTCNVETDKCEPKICDACSTCELGICVTTLECCAEKPCNSCQECVEGKCVDRDCGECGQCNLDTNACTKNDTVCKAHCGEPNCETCVGIPGQIGFECQHICVNDDASCCCMDDDCKKFCTEQGLVPNCDCGVNKCACTQIGHIVVNKIHICTEKCIGCNYTDCEGMVLNLVGDTLKDGKPTCRTAKLDRAGETHYDGNCEVFGSAMDNAICAGCYQYPLEGDIDLESTVEWKGNGTWTGSFCVSWFPENNMDVKCNVVEGGVTNCGEVCDCRNDEQVQCPDKVSKRSKKTGRKMVE